MADPSRAVVQPAGAVRVRVSAESATVPDAVAASPGAITIGREEGDIRVPGDPYLSQQHARVELRGASCTLRDCGSTNGTFVRIRGPLELRPGDEIMIGSQLFRVVAR